MITVILVMAALLGLNALFVAAEFAIVGAPRTALEALAEGGSRRAARVKAVVTDPVRLDRFIATAQLGITIASLGLGMFAEQRIAGYLTASLGNSELDWLGSHALASAIAIGISTYLHIVLGEMVPKALALTDPTRVALWITPLMLGIQTAAYPAVLGLNGIGNALLRVFGVERSGTARDYSPEELQHIVHESEAGGLLGAEEAHVFDRLLEFGDLTAREVMVPRVRIRGIELRSTRRELLEVLSASPHTRYPLYAHDLDHIVGMIHVRDLARSRVVEQGIRQADIRPIPFVPGSATLDTVLAAMRDAQTQIAVVMDEHGGTDGIVTTEDLFEEIVGEIDDRGEQHEMVMGDGGSLMVRGTVRVEEIGDHFDVELEHEEVDTVSGLVLALLDRPPRVGDRVSYHGFGLEVVAVSGHGVTRCRVTPPAAPEAEARTP